MWLQSDVSHWSTRSLQMTNLWSCCARWYRLHPSLAQSFVTSGNPLLPVLLQGVTWCTTQQEHMPCHRSWEDSCSRHPSNTSATQHSSKQQVLRINVQVPVLKSYQSSHMGRGLRSSSSSSHPPNMAVVHRRAAAAGWWSGRAVSRHHGLSCTMHTQSTGKGR